MGAHQTRLYRPLTIVAIALAYVWFARLAGDPLHHGGDGPGYYTMLGRAFASGHLDLPIAPAPELLALPDPWDAKANEPFRQQDLAFFGGRYYLYHGGGPALLLFAPYRLLTGHDLPEWVGAVVLCLGAYLLALAAFMRLTALARSRLPAWFAWLVMLALGACTGVPFLLSRIWVYEIAIAGGALGISAGTYCLLRGLEQEPASGWLIGSGAAFGFAVACRPHLLFVGAIALLGLSVWTWRARPSEGAVRRLRPLLALAAPMALAGVVIAAYNEARFGSPLEFGVRYILSSDAEQRRIDLSADKLARGAATLLARAPEVGGAFPWVRSRPLAPADAAAAVGGHYVEPVTGALFVAPFIVGVLALPFLRPASRAISLVLWVGTASALAVLAFVAATGFATQRYLVDFLPALALAALVVACQLAASSGDRLRRAIVVVTAVAIACGLAVSVALGIKGP